MRKRKQNSKGKWKKTGLQKNNKIEYNTCCKKRVLKENK